MVVVGYSERREAIKSEKKMKGKEEEGWRGAIAFTSGRQRVFEEKVGSEFDAQKGSKETQKKEEEKTRFLEE